MCVPIIGAAIGAAASIGGGIMKAQQQQEYIDNLNKAKMESFNIARIARDREERRQDKFTKRGYRGLNKTRKAIDAESQKADMATAQAKFVAENDPSAAFGALAPDPSAGNDQTIAEQGKIIADAAAKARSSISSLGALSSFGTVTGAARERLLKNADALAILNNIRQGSASVYQNVESKIEPRQVDPPDTTMADMLTGFGGLFNRSPSSYG